jgi:hypothetical protein
MRSFEGQMSPFKIEYRYRPQEYGKQLVRLFLLKNDEASKLGSTPLPDGTVRVFRDNGREGLSYLTQQDLKYIPIGDKIELNLGPDPEVIHELIKLRIFRADLILQINGTSEFRKIGGDGTFKEENATLVASRTISPGGGGSRELPTVHILARAARLARLSRRKSTFYRPRSSVQLTSITVRHHPVRETRPSPSKRCQPSVLLGTR